MQLVIKINTVSDIIQVVNQTCGIFKNLMTVYINIATLENQVIFLQDEYDIRNDSMF